jgi:hypothetical protein
MEPSFGAAPTAAMYPPVITMASLSSMPRPPAGGLGAAVGGAESLDGGGRKRAGPPRRYLDDPAEAAAPANGKRSKHKKRRMPGAEAQPGIQYVLPVRPPVDILSLAPVAQSREAMLRSHVLGSDLVPLEAGLSWDDLELPDVEYSAKPYALEPAFWAFANRCFTCLSPELARAVLGLTAETAEEILANDPIMEVPRLGRQYCTYASDEEAPAGEGGEAIRVRMLWSWPGGAVAGPSAGLEGAPNGEGAGSMGHGVGPCTFSNPKAGPLPGFHAAATVKGQGPVQVTVKSEKNGGQASALTASPVQPLRDLRLIRFWVLEQGDDAVGAAEDEVGRELLAHQEQLVALTRRNADTALRLQQAMGAAFDDAQDEYDDRLAMRKTLERYKVEYYARVQAAEDEQRRQDDALESDCNICRCGDGSGKNAIVYCDSCNLGVHTFCYFLPAVPPGNWHCRSCDELMKMGIKTVLERDCALCPGKGGAVLPTRCGQWAHIECAKWLGLISPSGLIPALDSRLKRLRRRIGDRFCCCVKKCANMRLGGLIKCSADNCYRFFHVSCGRRAQFEMHHGNRFADMAWKAYCTQHSSLERVEAAKLQMCIERQHVFADDIKDVNPCYNDLWEEERQEAVVRRGAGKAPPKPGSLMEAGFRAYEEQLRLNAQRTEEVDRENRSGVPNVPWNMWKMPWSQPHAGTGTVSMGAMPYAGLPGPSRRDPSHELGLVHKDSVLWPGAPSARDPGRGLAPPGMRQGAGPAAVHAYAPEYPGVSPSAHGQQGHGPGQGQPSGRFNGLAHLEVNRDFLADPLRPGPSLLPPVRFGPGPSPPHQHQHQHQHQHAHPYGGMHMQMQMHVPMPMPMPSPGRGLPVARNAEFAFHGRALAGPLPRGMPKANVANMMSLGYGPKPKGPRPKPKPLHFQCEGCGTMITTKTNLDRHKQKHCPVLAKGLPRPPPKPIEAYPPRMRRILEREREEPPTDGHGGGQGAGGRHHQQHYQHSHYADDEDSSLLLDGDTLGESVSEVDLDLGPDSRDEFDLGFMEDVFSAHPPKAPTSSTPSPAQGMLYTDVMEI